MYSKISYTVVEETVFGIPGPTPCELFLIADSSSMHTKHTNNSRKINYMFIIFNNSYKVEAPLVVPTYYLPVILIIMFYFVTITSFLRNSS